MRRIRFRVFFQCKVRAALTSGSEHRYTADAAIGCCEEDKQLEGERNVDLADPFDCLSRLNTVQAKSASSK